jgi:hypothetical protein
MKMNGVLVASSGQAFQTEVLLSVAKCNSRALDCPQRLKCNIILKFLRKFFGPTRLFWKGVGSLYKEITRVKAER